MNAEEAARATTEPVAYLPAGFMMAGATYKRGAELGFEGIDFYTAGRGGALGDVDSSVVAAAFVFFNPATVHEAWERARPVLPRRAAAEAFASCLEAWAVKRLPDEVDHARLAELLGTVNRRASVAAAPLFAAWRSLPEPADPKALALHRLNVLRELRGAMHGASVVAMGLGPREAVMLRTPEMAGVFGWAEPHPDVASCQDRWNEAEAATNRAIGHVLAVLDEIELAELVDLAGAAHKGADRG
jgi:hypothetical protein